MLYLYAYMASNTGHACAIDADDLAIYFGQRTLIGGAFGLAMPFALKTFDGLPRIHWPLSMNVIGAA